MKNIAVEIIRYVQKVLRRVISHDPGVTGSLSGDGDWGMRGQGRSSRGENAGAALTRTRGRIRCSKTGTHG